MRDPFTKFFSTIVLSNARGDARDGAARSCSADRSTIPGMQQRIRNGGLLLLIAFALGGSGCRESRATRILDSAQDLARHGHYDDAIGALEGLEARFPSTTAAAQAPKLVTLYKGLRDAELKEDRRRAKDEMIALGRALFDYFGSRRRYPQSLQDLPKSDTLPLVDPWGGEYHYSTSSGGQRYRLECFGRDGLQGGSGDDQDLRVLNGEFVADLPWTDR